MIRVIGVKNRLSIPFNSLALSASEMVVKLRMSANSTVISLLSPSKPYCSGFSLITLTSSGGTYCPNIPCS